MKRIVVPRVAGPALLALPLAAGCGAGVVAVAASSGGSSGSSVVPAIMLFRVEHPKEPARAALRFTTSTRATVELLYQPPGAPDPARLTRIGPNPRELERGEHEIAWPFELEPGLAASYTPGVLVYARIPGVVDAPRAGENAQTLGMGNDEPEVEVEQPAAEVAGVVPVRLRLADSSDDAVAVKVEFDVAGDALEWLPARAAGLEASDPTPDPALGDIVARADGTDVVFFWDSDFDLHDLERDVLLRFTPLDPVATGLSATTQLFRVDNNEEPIVQLQNDAVIANSDEVRGIPVPFRVVDEENDLVQVVLQWRREDEEFPELLGSEVVTVLADPLLRRERHVCTPYTRYAFGRVLPVDGTHVRLPEIAQRESWVLATGIEGRALELLRPLAVAVPAWDAGPLVAPVAALALGDGSTALVLDAPARLREIELASGVLVREIATIGGVATALAAEVVPGGSPELPRAVLVAIDDAGTGRIVRVALADGGLAELALPSGSLPPVRGIASLGKSEAVLTAGSELLFLEYADPLAPRLATLARDLAAPWGVAVDPLARERVLLAESAAVTPGGVGRILAFDLDRRAAVAVVPHPQEAPLPELREPRALALQADGGRMLVVVGVAGEQRLVALDLGAPREDRLFPVSEVRTETIASVAVGPDGLILASLPDSGGLLVGGGLLQRRTIAAYDVATQTATLDEELEPLPEPGTSWRVRGGLDQERPARADGRTSVFVWDAETDLPSGGTALLRALAFDEERGLPSEGTAPKRIRAALQVEPVVVTNASASGPRALVMADLDGDGDPDFATANRQSDNASLFFQDGSAGFVPRTIPRSAAVDDPRSIGSGDLDGDGDVDLVLANQLSNNLTIFHQQPAGVFAGAPVAVGAVFLDSPFPVLVADIDGDGDQDLTSAKTTFNGGVRMFRQAPGGSFDSPPVALSSEFLSYPRFVTSGDVDSDGDLDLAISGEHTLGVFFQESDGDFDPEPLLLRSTATGGTEAVALGDLDSDGDQDLVSANGVGDTLGVLLQDTSGGFETWFLLGSPAVTKAPAWVAIGDLDGDGDQDLVDANESGDDLTVFLQDVPGSFEREPLTLGGRASTPEPRAVVVGDVEGDGDLDVASACGGGNDLVLFLQSSQPALTDEPLLLPAADPVHAAMGDLDGNGVPDLVSANHLADAVDIHFQRSIGTFDPTPLRLASFPTINGPTQVGLADLDMDGDLDLACASGSQIIASERLSVFFQESAGVFGSTPLSRSLPGLFSFAIGDVDGDGGQDLLTNRGLILQLPGEGFENTPRPLEVGSHVLLQDLDRDGDLDIVSSAAIRFQTEPAVFGPLVPVFVDPVIALACSDVDADGDVDLASSSRDTDRLTLLFQTSPGNFAGDPVFLGDAITTRDPGRLALADVDGDQDQDILCVTNDLVIFRARTPGVFATVPRLLVVPGGLFGGNPQDIVSGDLDADGDLDLVLPNDSFGNENLTVYWGGR